MHKHYTQNLEEKGKYTGNVITQELSPRRNLTYRYRKIIRRYGNLTYRYRRIIRRYEVTHDKKQAEVAVLVQRW